MALVDDSPVQMSSGNVSLPVGIENIKSQQEVLIIAGSDGFTDVGEYPHGATSKWLSTTDSLSWNMTVNEPGTFKVKVISAAVSRNLSKHSQYRSTYYKSDDDLAVVSFQCSNQTVQGKLDEADPVLNFRSKYRPTFASDLGSLVIEKPGNYKAVLKADHINTIDPMGLIIYEVRLEKQRSLESYD